MKVAGLDSSGPDYMFIGVIVGEDVVLKYLHEAMRRGRRRIHMRRYSRSAKKRVVATFLKKVAEVSGSIYTLSIRTGVADALAKARARTPYAPSSMLRLRCLRLLGLHVWRILDDYRVSTIYCDRELVKVFVLAGVRVKSSGYAAELADVVAWLDYKGLQDRRLPTRLDISEALTRRLLEEIGRKGRAHITPCSPAAALRSAEDSALTPLNIPLR